MLLGYNTNGLAHHDIIDAIEMLAEIGYRSVAITVDHHTLSPFDPHWRDQLEHVAGALQQANMRSVIETGARFLLDREEKHEPTLMADEEDRQAVRIAYLRHCIDVAARLGSDCVSLWSGRLLDEATEDEAYERLCGGLERVVRTAQGRGVKIGFEPEPGMFIDTMERFGQLLDRLGDTPLSLTLDIGHLHCKEETPIAEQIHRWSDRLANVHIEDMRTGEHEHLMFGDGEIDFPPIVAALEDVGYDGALHVELSRHSHVGPTAARQAMEFLKPLI
jgi:L-ribulose-5-phosphate 3-epimerase